MLNCAEESDEADITTEINVLTCVQRLVPMRCILSVSAFVCWRDTARQ